MNFKYEFPDFTAHVNKSALQKIYSRPYNRDAENAARRLLSTTARLILSDSDLGLDKDAQYASYGAGTKAVILQPLPDILKIVIGYNAASDVYEISVICKHGELTLYGQDPVEIVRIAKDRLLNEEVKSLMEEKAALELRLEELKQKLG